MSFLGFGLPIEIPSYSGMLSREGRQYMEALQVVQRQRLRVTPPSVLANYSALEHERMCDALVAPRVCRLARITCAALRAQAFASQINSRTAGSSATRRARAVP